MKVQTLDVSCDKFSVCPHHKNFPPTHWTSLLTAFFASSSLPTWCANSLYFLEYAALKFLKAWYSKGQLFFASDMMTVAPINPVTQSCGQTEKSTRNFQQSPIIIWPVRKLKSEVPCCVSFQIPHSLWQEYNLFTGEAWCCDSHLLCVICSGGTDNISSWW